MLCHRRCLGDRFRRMLCRLGGLGGCFAALFWWMLCHRRRLGDRFRRMLCRLGGLGGCFATFVVLPILALLAL